MTLKFRPTLTPLDARLVPSTTATTDPNAPPPTDGAANVSIPPTTPTPTPVPELPPGTANPGTRRPPVRNCWR